MDINEFRPAFMELISVPLAREQIQKGVKYLIKYYININAKRKDV